MKKTIDYNALSDDELAKSYEKEEKRYSKLGFQTAIAGIYVFMLSGLILLASVPAGITGMIAGLAICGTGDFISKKALKALDAIKAAFKNRGLEEDPDCLGHHNRVARPWPNMNFNDKAPRSVTPESSSIQTPTSPKAGI